MEINLLKRVALYIRANFKIPKEIKGYSDEDVARAVSDLESKGVINYVKLKKITPKVDNHKIEIGHADSGKYNEAVDIDGVTISEYEFKKNYGESIF
jgi:hypothetical protein